MKQKPSNANKTQTQHTLGQVSMMTGKTILEKDVDALFECLLNAMQAKNLLNPSSIGPQ